ncbi:MAG: helix-turn-helix transcriptional regulator, partial [Ruminiclostridium sp.]|nr:helix-turn-helix transcriptional regulator [Ruminiclostridium sp.]
TAEMLAELAGYSKSRFAHKFLEITGTTPKKYQNDLRLEMSLEILTSTNRSVTEVAYDCGFNDPLYFSRAFKKKYGVCPSEFKILKKSE